MKIHWPFRIKKEGNFCPENFLLPDIPATWQAMEKLYDSGKARAIGVSNFSCKKLGDLLEVARIPPAVNQVECHPGWQQKKLHEFCQSKGVHITVSSSSYLRNGSHRYNCSFQMSLSIQIIFLNLLCWVYMPFHFRGVIHAHLFLRGAHVIYNLKRSLKILPL